jgi:hypothetical protein
MHSHSESDRSVGYVFLVRARVANYYPTHPFRTVSEDTFSEIRIQDPAYWAARAPDVWGECVRLSLSLHAPCYAGE